MWKCIKYILPIQCNPLDEFYTTMTHAGCDMIDLLIDYFWTSCELYLAMFRIILPGFGFISDTSDLDTDTGDLGMKEHLPYKY